MKKSFLLFFLTILFYSIIYPQIGGYALKFDGTDDYVNTSYNTDLTTFTIECWVKGDAAPGSSKVSGVVHRVQNFEISWDHTDASFRGAAGILVGGTWYAASFGTLNANVWYHLAATYDGHDLKSYKNGVLITTNSSPEGNPAAETRTLKIGAHGGVTAEGSYFAGMIDEVRIWNSVRTQSDIITNMYKEIGTDANLKVYFKMSDGSGTSLTDNSGNSNTGTLTNGPTWKPSGCFAGSRQALDFDGTNDYVDFTSSPSYTNAALTIEAWIKPMFNNEEKPFVTWYSAWNNVVEFRRGSGRLEFGMNDGSFGAVAGNTTLIYGEWVHVAVTKEGNNVKLYVNGVLDATGTLTKTNVPAQFRIGYLAHYNTYFTGQLDEVRIWNTVRTASEIRDNMMVNLVVGNESGLVAYYRMDQYDGTTLYDITGNGKNGTLTNMDPATDWVSDSPFNNMWIGGESNAWSDAANWTGGIPATTDNIGLYKWTLPNVTTYDVSNSSDFTTNNILISSTSTPTLPTTFTVNGSFIIQNDLNITGKTITLGDNGYLSEGSYRLTGTSGTITTTRTLGTLASYTNVGGLGFSLKSTGDLGSTTITRGVAPAISGGLTYPISRYYDATSAGGGTIDIIFKYADGDRNGGVEADLRLFKSTDIGSSWTKQTSATPDFVNKTFTLTGLTSLSRWTLADNASPLPVELSSFSAMVNKQNVVTLTWQTATEVNNYGFEVERTSPLPSPKQGEGGEAGRGWENLGFIKGNSNSNSPKTYSFTDNTPPAGKVQYRLKQIDNDGSYKYSEYVEVNVGLPSTTELHQNYPNPFNPSTSIKFSLDKDAIVGIKIFDLLGREVKELINETRQAGSYIIYWNGDDGLNLKVTSGVYVYQLMINNKLVAARKMNLLK